MSAIQPILSEREWSMVLALLENERKDLPVEIRRTDSMDFSDELHERQTMIDTLVEKLRSQGITA